MASDRHHYIPAFDGLRALAIIPVMLLHVSVVTLQPGWLRFQLSRGWYGVDLFFVLSGFLITWILMEEIEATGTISLSRFFSRRFLRLGPAYVTTLVVLLAGAAFIYPNALHKVPAVAPALLSYTYNYQPALQKPHFDLIVVVWSLCVEEQFYLVWPLILRKLGTHRGFYFCAGAVLALAIYRSALYAWFNWGHLASPTPASSIRIYFSTDTRIDVIMAGCLVALSLRHERTHRFWQRLRESKLFPYAAAAIMLGCIAWVTGGHSSSASIRSATIGYTLGAIAVGGLIVAIFMQPNCLISRMLGWSPLVKVGKVSYGMYLFHLTMAWGILYLLEPRSWSYLAECMSDPIVVGPALPVSKATVVPMSQALCGASAVLAEYPLLRFTIGLFAVGAVAFIAAWAHFEFVERKFMMLRRPVTFRAAIPGRET
jgi:peptidoglycan/LPS O-acetylase OafA/YrhL